MMSEHFNSAANSAGPAAGVPLACWNCEEAADGGVFCPACRRIQPLPAGADYFSLLGLERRLCLDVDDLERRFHQLSWSLHPDNFVKASNMERQISMDRSSQLNDAFRALRDPVSRVEYLLARAGMRKEGQNKQQAPPELLEEVFELNESIEELRMARKSGADRGETSELLQRLEEAERAFSEKLGEVDAELQHIFAEWDAALDACAAQDKQQELMARMNDILNRRSYIRNLVASVQKELTGAPAEG